MEILRVPEAVFLPNSSSFCRKMAINVERMVVKKPAVFKEMVGSANVSLSAHAPCTSFIILQGNSS